MAFSCSLFATSAGPGSGREAFVPTACLQELGQVLRGEVPEEVAAQEQLVADLHGMVADLPRSLFVVTSRSPMHGFGL